MAEQKKPQESEELVQKANTAIDQDGEISEDALDAVAGGRSILSYMRQGYTVTEAVQLAKEKMRQGPVSML